MKAWMAPSGHHIAYGEPGDATQLARLHAQGFFRGWPVSEFESYLVDPKSTPCYVATDANRRICGFALMRVAVPEAELLTIAVDRFRRGKGFGAALLQAVFADLPMSGVRSVFLEVEAGNKGALALYKRFGFTSIGERQSYYEMADGSRATALVMRADLG